MSIKTRINNISYNKDLSIDYKPITAKIQLCGMCTLNCKFCENQLFKKQNIRQQKLSDQKFNVILKNLKTIPSLKEIGLFYMGQSGLHEKITDYYKIIYQNNYFTYLTTNATYIKYILNAIPYIQSLKVSWNYLNINDFITKTQGTQKQYYSIIQNINILYNTCHKHGKKLAISTILDCQKESYDKILSELKYDQHYYLPLQSQGGFNKSGNSGVLGEIQNLVSPIPCWSLFKGIYIDVNLNIRLCCYGHKDYHILGNLNQQTLLQILSSDKLKKIKEKHLNNIIPKECINCLST